MAVFAKNQRAEFDYELGEKFEAGLELRGFEVKAIKTGKAKLAGGHIVLQGGQAYLVGASISPYQPRNLPASYQPERAIRLLLTKKELGRLAGLARQQGLTAIPLLIYDRKGRLKLGLAVARGKKKYDKREAIKKREAKRQIARTLKKRG